MWFEFPAGSDRISVQQQEFLVAHTDKEGRNFFRAPDHFAGIILDLPGFRTVSNPGPDFPPDLPKENAARVEAIGQLGGQVDALRAEMDGLKALLATTSAERDELRRKLNDAEAEISNLKSDLEEAQTRGKEKK